MDNINWYQKKAQEVIRSFNTDEQGLSQKEAELRLRKYGKNKLPEGKVDGLAIIILRQFQSPIIYILLLASFIVFLIGEVTDSLIILAVLIFNAVIGTIQEGKAQNTLLALKNFVDTKATVLRDGQEMIIPDYEVVPGDILLLIEGEKVSADARVIVSNSLRVDEAMMTGESKPAHKLPEPIKHETSSFAELRNMVFKGTHISSGNGKAVVVGTGINTAIGKIASEIALYDAEIPLKTNIKNLSRLIIYTVAGISAVLFVLGILQNKPFVEMFATVVSLAVSVIPEGLPIAVTLILAAGVWRMSKRNALVKKLQAVEALGQARLIAVDKTGTITKNELVIRNIYANGKMFEVKGVGYEPKGEIIFENEAIDSVNHPELINIGKIAAFCADARVMMSEDTKAWKVSGDPTEAALLVFAEKLGIHKENLLRETPVIAQIPFDYRLKYHAVASGGEKEKLMVVGAPEVILKSTDKIQDGNKARELAKKEKDELEKVFIKMSKQGLRVVALAEKNTQVKSLSSDDISGLVFIGFLGMKDALREEVFEALEKSRSAGIRVVMVTGDHKVTAQAIAKEAGIFCDGDNVLSGEDIDSMPEKELIKLLPKTSVFSRVNPDHKLKIIRAFQSRGEIVAMTGDGVNDAPSLVAADLGVAMGKVGTEVAKEASDIILLDDNFGSIVAAVEEGRSIYKTIKKVILYLFSTNFAEVFVIVGAMLLGLPLPILPSQIIWLNFVTDGFLDVSLAMEPKEKGLLENKFEKPKKYLIDKFMVKRMLFMSLTMAIGALFVFREYLGNDMAKIYTITLTTLAVSQWFNAWSCRSDSSSLFTNFFSNKFLIASTLLIIVLQLFAVYNPIMQKILRTTALDIGDWLFIIPVAFSVVVIEEIRKLAMRRGWVQAS